VPTSSDSSVSSEGRPRMDSHFVGKFFLWSLIALIGWSFYHTEKHETAIAVIQEKLEHIDQKILIDQRLRDIQEEIRSLQR